MVCAQTLEHLGLDRLAARRIADRVAALRLANDPGTCWRRITRSVLSPNEPVEVHRCIWEAVFAEATDYGTAFELAIDGPEMVDAEVLPLVVHLVDVDPNDVTTRIGTAGWPGLVRLAAL